MTGILSDIFPENRRALVMSIFNWGIYGGYGIAFPVGRYIPPLNLWNMVRGEFKKSLCEYLIVVLLGMEKCVLHFGSSRAYCRSCYNNYLERATETIDRSKCY